MPNNLLAAAAGGAGRPPAGLLLALVPLLVLIVALDVYCLIDLARAKSVRNVPKWVWVLVILFISAPIGALIYLFAGRDRGQDGQVAPAQQVPARQVPAEPTSPGEPRPLVVGRSAAEDARRWRLARLARGCPPAASRS